jgi:hypothetical protein
MNTCCLYNSLSNQQIIHWSQLHMISMPKHKWYKLYLKILPTHAFKSKPSQNYKILKNLLTNDDKWQKPKLKILHLLQWHKTQSCLETTQTSCWIWKQCFVFGFGKIRQIIFNHTQTKTLLVSICELRNITINIHYSFINKILTLHTYVPNMTC